MAQKRETPNHPDFVLYRDLPKGNSTPIVIFHRNNLSLERFQKDINGFLYKECFNYKGISGEIIVRVYDDDPYQILFGLKKKTLRVRGTKNNFCLTLQLKNKRIPCLDEIIRREHLEIHFQCNGESWPIRPFQLKGIKSASHNGKSSYSHHKIDSANGWSAQHPFSGGSVTPK